MTSAMTFRACEKNDDMVTFISKTDSERTFAGPSLMKVVVAFILVVICTQSAVFFLSYQQIITTLTSCNFDQKHIQEQFQSLQKEFDVFKTFYVPCKKVNGSHPFLLNKSKPTHKNETNHKVEPPYAFTYETKNKDNATRNSLFSHNGTINNLMNKSSVGSYLFNVTSKNVNSTSVYINALLAKSSGHDNFRMNRLKRTAFQPNYIDGMSDPSKSMQIPDTRETSLDFQEYSGYTSPRSSKVTHPWLALTAFSNIPYKAVEQFCARTRDACQPGPPGHSGTEGTKGPKGDKGDTGDRGLPGTIGARGPPGLPGPVGPARGIARKGGHGRPGTPGLDGRDGLPGEPGLDGIPGRNGLDGIPGVDGLPGLDGDAGRNGKDGRDGQKGEKGLKGDRGPIGPTGMTGPRGRKGLDGEPGSPGAPGISTWKVNNTAIKELLIPPSIPGYSAAEDPLTVREGDHVRLRCTAAGHPPPKVEWRREDGAAIPTGRWKDGSVEGPILNITHVRRDHTGRYRCEAYNGIPPSSYRTYHIEVQFEPFLKVKEWKVGSHNGSSARLECIVEAFPPAETHWENKYGRRLETTSDTIVRYEPDLHISWRGRMTLIVVNMRASDFGDYHCIARNALAITRGLVSIYEIDSRLFISSTGSTSGISYGPDPPNYSELFNDLCPPPTICPTCPALPPQIPGAGLQYCLNIEQFGHRKYGGFRNRSEDCQVSAVGKPVFHRHTNATFGSWMQEARPENQRDVPKFYTTDPSKAYNLLEFVDKDTFRKNKPVKNHTLPYPFVGNSHLVYNSTFFYHQRNSANLVRYELFSGVASKLILPQLIANTSNFLYKESRDYLDLSVDENGLWVIYGLPQNNNTIVAKIDPNSLKIEYSWNISLNNHKFGEMFITCGVLYGIDSTTTKDTKIRLAFDLYTQTLREVDLPFTNPFQRTTMLGYNPHTKEIYSWDSGNQLSYPIKHSTNSHQQKSAEYETAKGKVPSLRELG